jgi:CBS-domain-containing membrane protein
MLTDRDICMAAYTRGLPLSELPVSGAMSTALATCHANDTLRSIMDLMSARQVRRVPVVDEDEQLLGIVSLADLALLTQAPTPHSQEARSWLSGVLAGISEPPRSVARNGDMGPS